MAQQRTAVSGDDFGDWSAWVRLAGLAASFGVVPKQFRPAIGMATTGLAIYTIAKRLGWI